MALKARSRMWNRNLIAMTLLYVCVSQFRCDLSQLCLLPWVPSSCTVADSCVRTTLPCSDREPYICPSLLCLGEEKLASHHCTGQLSTNSRMERPSLSSCCCSACQATAGIYHWSSMLLLAQYVTGRHWDPLVKQQGLALFPMSKGWLFSPEAEQAINTIILSFAFLPLEHPHLVQPSLELVSSVKQTSFISVKSICCLVSFTYWMQPLSPIFYDDGCVNVSIFSS